MSEPSAVLPLRKYLPFFRLGNRFDSPDLDVPREKLREYLPKRALESYLVFSLECLRIIMNIYQAESPSAACKPNGIVYRVAKTVRPQVRSGRNNSFLLYSIRDPQWLECFYHI